MITEALNSGEDLKSFLEKKDQELELKESETHPDMVNSVLPSKEKNISWNSTNL